MGTGFAVGVAVPPFPPPSGLADGAVVPGPATVGTVVVGDPTGAADCGGNELGCVTVVGALLRSGAGDEVGPGSAEGVPVALPSGPADGTAVVGLLLGDDVVGGPTGCDGDCVDDGGKVMGGVAVVGAAVLV